MQVTAPMVGFMYAPGEEVVARLQGIEAAAVDDRRTLAGALLPDWTIGEVMDRVEVDGMPHYLLRFRHRGVVYMALVHQMQIDGTA